MAVVQTNIENQQKISLPRRIATYITSMNFAKVFRRQQHPKESSSPITKSSFIPYHRYPRPFSYHIPTNEQLSPTSNVIPYRIGLSSDNTLFSNGQTNENDDIVRLPIKTNRRSSPKIRKDRRYQPQLNANKRWLFRSMETLDGWKGKVFPPKPRTTKFSSRSVENLADENNHNRSRIKQRATSPNQSIEAITNRVINSIGIHRKSTPNSPALTIKKRAFYGHNNETNSSAILDFREISSLGFAQSKPKLNDDNVSVTLSENNLTDEEITSNHEHETADSWDFSITWIDSLKEQHSPQRKIQFYENLIQLLEQDTLNIDELLVLRKILAKIWPIDDNNNQIFSIDSKTVETKSLHVPHPIKPRPKLTHHTAQRCSSILEQSPLMYDTLHEQNSGHASSLLVAAKPCLIETTTEKDYPQHLNPFDDEKDILPSAPVEESNNESIRRYFERLTLLETIYEKLNLESNKTPIDHPKVSPNKIISNKFLEMNVDGTGSVSSGKSSLKRRAPTAPHLSQNHKPHPTMFTLSSNDLNIPHKMKSPDDKIHNTTASCDDDGHIFVYDEPSIPIPKKTERIHQWLSSCESKDSDNTHPKTQFKMRCIAKSIPSEKNLHNEIEPGRFRSCLKIHLETNDNRPSSEHHHHQRQQTNLDDDDDYFEHNTLTPNSQHDHQAVFL